MTTKAIRIDDLDDFYGEIFDETLLIRSQGSLWLAWESPEGDWFACRPRDQDEPVTCAELNYPPIGPVPIGKTFFPMVIVKAETALRSDR